MDSHLLFELAYVFYRIRSTIIHGEHWLMEASRKFCPFYPPCKGWLRDLAQRLFHNIVPHSFVRRAPAFPLVKMLILTGEKFAWWGYRALPVYSIFFIIRRDIRAWGVLLLFCPTELLSQIINLSLHGFFITLLISYMTFPLKTASIRVDGMHAAFLINFPIFFTLKIEEFILLLADSAWCWLVWCGSDPAIAVILYRSTSSSHRRRQL